MNVGNENKFNFSEDDASGNLEGKEPTTDPKGLFIGLKKFLYELLDIRQDVDKNQTIEDVKKDIPLKGATAWILVCSIFIASIGLNANSTAVVIGAMLISPLMGPILGMGMAIAINDIYTLRKSLINFAVMVVLSVFAAYLFFEFFPLRKDSSELLARTLPDIRDVLIAFFGGLALIIARTKKGTIASVIFGVAIATALMPPLCTVGFGLAKGGMQGLKYAGGAMYLFIINTIFIGLATFLVLKLLRFPMIKYANSTKRRRISQLASLVAFAVMIPAVWTFWTVLQESNINREYDLFIKQIEGNPKLWLQRSDLKLKEKQLDLYFNGEISEDIIAEYQNTFDNFEYIKDFKLNFGGNRTRSMDELSKSLNRAYNDLDDSRNIIAGLQKEIDQLKNEITELNGQLESKAALNNQNIVAFSKVAKDAKIRYAELRHFGFANMLHSQDFIKIDTIPVATVRWNNALSDSLKTVKEQQLTKWLREELQLDTLVVERMVK